MFEGFEVLGAFGGRGGANECEPYSQQSWQGHIGATSVWRPPSSCDGCGLAENMSSRGQKLLVADLDEVDLAVEAEDVEGTVDTGKIDRGAMMDISTRRRSVVL